LRALAVANSSADEACAVQLVTLCGSNDRTKRSRVKEMVGNTRRNICSVSLLKWGMDEVGTNLAVPVEFSQFGDPLPANALAGLDFPRRWLKLKAGTTGRSTLCQLRN
jgi:hypothetical protein